MPQRTWLPLTPRTVKVTVSPTMMVSPTLLVRISIRSVPLVVRPRRVDAPATYYNIPPRPARLGPGLVVPPHPLERQAPRVGRNQLAHGVWPPGTGRIEAYGRRRLQQRRRDFPQPLDAFGVCKQRPIATHGIQDQSLVGFQHVSDQRRIVHRKLQAQLVEAHSRPGPLAVEGKRHLRD